MYSVAICDDEEYDLDLTLSLLQEYNQKGFLSLSSYTSAIDLLHAAETTKIDIAILDIEMNEPNGYEIARRLKTRDTHPLVVFLTKSSKYTIRGYGVAFRYITKPIDREVFFTALDDAIAEISASRFTFSANGRSQIWKYSEIFYFEVLKHYVTLHTGDEEYTMRASLKDVFSALPQGYFCTPHHSYVVNCAHIKYAGNQDICLTNGVHIPISRRKRAEFEQQLHTYLGRV